MKRSVPALFCLVAALTVTGCSEKKHDLDQKAAPAALVKGVSIETAKTAPLPDTLEVVGTVRARTSAMVSARIPGIISMMRVREGDRVKKGEILARLDAQESVATAAAATAGIDGAKRGLDEAQTRKKLADITFERYQKLFNEQAVTRQEFDTRQTEKDLAAQGVAQAEARLKQAQEGARAASTMADYNKITAPISGVITVKQADLGATVFPSQPLLTIEDEGSYQLELSVPESLSTKVRPGSSAAITLEALNSSFTAKIAEVVPSADSASRTFIAKVNLGQKGLKSGMYGRAAISLGTTTTGMLIPAKAVVERGALTSVWVVGKDGIARMRLVKVGRNMGERVEILSGLADGERLAVSEVEKIVDGAKVE